MKTPFRRTLVLLAMLVIPACGSSNSTDSTDPISGILGMVATVADVRPQKGGVGNEGSLSGVVLGDAVSVSWFNPSNGASGMADLAWVQGTEMVQGTAVPVWNHVWSASSIPLSPGRNEIVITATDSSGASTTESMVIDNDGSR
jgi:hypothetical protein